MSPTCRPGVNGALLCFVLLSGLCSGLHHYKFIDEPKTWGEARQYCREKFTDLATVDSMEDVDQLIAAADSGFSGKVWIGLYDNTSSWKSSMTDDGYYGTNNELFLKWADREPNDRRKYWIICTTVHKGELYDVPCHYAKPFVCYDNSNTSSPPRYVFKSWNILTRNRNWDGAQSYCRKFHTDLVSMRNEEEWTRVMQAITVTEPVYTGMYGLPFSSWSDGTEHGFKNWLDRNIKYKRGNCVTSLIGAADAGKWVEDQCDQKLPFMCHYEKKLQFRIKLKFLKSTTDLNDPAVTEAILKELEEKLKEKGIKSGLKLRLIKKPDNTTFQEERDEL